MVNDVDRDRNAVYVLTDADSHKDVAAAASWARAAVTQGALTCTKCTSAGSSIPASAMACCTAAATRSTWARRPTCSGGRTGEKATPMASRFCPATGAVARSEEHTSELQSLMRISYAAFCLKKKKASTP